MALDGVGESEVEIVPLQTIPAAVSEVGALIQCAGEADVVDTVIVLTLTKQEASVRPVLEVMFAGDPSKMERIMKASSEIVKSIADEAVRGVNRAEYEASATAHEPWDYM